MLIPLHAVFLVYLGLALVWNLLATLGPGTKGPWERAVLLPLQVLLTVVLVHDRVVPDGPAWLEVPALAALFPLAFLVALVQNGAAIAARGARLTDIPLVLYNAGLGLCLVAGVRALLGADLATPEAVLLHDHGLLQLLLGTRIAPLWTLSWHVPLLLRRGTPVSLPGLAAGLFPAALATFVVLVLALLHGPAATVMASFEAEPTLATAPADLSVGVLERPDRRGPAGAPPGDLLAWTLPADHGGMGLPAVPAGRRLLVELQPPAAWALGLPPVEDRLDVFLDGAERLAGTLHPDVLLPFPEPDGLAEAGWLHGIPLGPEAWADLLRRAAARVAAVSPATRLGVRLAGDVSVPEGPSGRLLTALLEPPRAVEVVGPRLMPGGSGRGGAAQAGDLLVAWEQRLERAPGGERPELWVLAAGLSPLDFGERAQARFLEGCLARAAASPRVSALIVDGWRDGARTLGLCRPDGTPRRAGLRLAALLPSRPTGAAR